MNVRLWLNTNFVSFYACFKQNDASHDICIKYTKQDSLLLKNRRSAREREIFAFFFSSGFSLVNVIIAIALWYKSNKTPAYCERVISLCPAHFVQAIYFIDVISMQITLTPWPLGLPSCLCIQEPSVLSKELFLCIKHTNLFVRVSIFMSF